MKCDDCNGSGKYMGLLMIETCAGCAGCGGSGNTGTAEIANVLGPPASLLRRMSEELHRCPGIGGYETVTIGGVVQSISIQSTIARKGLSGEEATADNAVALMQRMSREVLAHYEAHQRMDNENRWRGY